MPFSRVGPKMRWVSVLSFVRHGYEGTVLALYGDNRPTLVKIKYFGLSYEDAR